MSSYVVATSQANPRAAGQRVDFRFAPLLLTGLVSVLAVGGLTGSFSLREVALVAFSIQVLTAYEIIRARERILSISSAFGVIWLIYFPLRLLVLTFLGPSPYDFPAVVAATPAQLVSAWEVISAAFLLFLVGQLLANRTIRIRRSVDNVRMTYGQVFAVGLVGVVIQTLWSTFQINWGILHIVGDVAVFAIGGTSYLEAKAKKRPYASPSLLLVVAASAYGYLNGYKLLMLMPVGAWLIGRAGAGDRLRLRHVVVLAAATAVAFGIIQGERDALRNGRPAANPISALQVGLSSYDLASGAPADYHGVGLVGNALSGVFFRLKGADYYITISDSVPSRVPYQHGRSLWEPALSILPGAKQFLGLEPEYQSLSLMVYSNQVIFGRTGSPVAESVTQPGDLYLNFGSAGVMVGMLILGLLYGAFDRAFIIKGPVSAGVVAYAGLALLEVDPNVAYILVTSGLRLGICLLLLAWISLSQRRPSQNERARP